VATVRELTAAYADILMTPRPGPAVCVECFNLTRGYGSCYACAGRPRILATVVPISYSIAHEPLHQALALYKRSTAAAAQRHSAELAAILWRFLAVHERCVARASGVARFALVTTVPSSDPGRDAQHPLRRIVAELVRPTRSRYRRLLVPSAVDKPPRTFDASRFVPLRRLAGEPVLLIDDTWTTGASAQSAAVALRHAGSGPVAAVVIGRHVNREWHENDARLRALAGRFDWADCAVCDRSASTSGRDPGARAA
jgi:hypothetical protein